MGSTNGHAGKVVLINAARQQILVGVAPGNVRTLHVFDEPPAVTLSTKLNPLTSARSGSQSIPSGAQDDARIRFNNRSAALADTRLGAGTSIHTVDYDSAHRQWRF